MTFTADAWTRNAAAWETIRTMPFNEELAAGTLSRERFEHYIVQDAHYLHGGSARALSIAAAKARTRTALVQFHADAAQRVRWWSRRALHGSLFPWRKFAITEVDVRPHTPLAGGAHQTLHRLS